MTLKRAEARVRMRYVQAQKGAQNAEEREGDYMDLSAAEWRAEAEGLKEALRIIEQERVIEENRRQR